MRWPPRGMRLAASLLLAAALPAAAAPSIAIIIDDMGNLSAAGERAVKLPGALTYSFLPHTPYAARLAREAHTRGKQVMLHLPMEAVGGNRLGPGGLTLNMNRPAFLRTVAGDLAAIPFVEGINNHMGSLLTRKTRQMDWLMEGIKRRPGHLFFVDSRTSGRSVAEREADRRGVPAIARDVFLDAVQSPGFVHNQFARLLARARRYGWAVGIGHPYPHTLAVLEQELPRLREAGVKLVPVSTLIVYREEKRFKLWQASLSPSRPAAKSSKPSR